MFIIAFFTKSDNIEIKTKIKRNCKISTYTTCILFLGLIYLQIFHCQTSLDFCLS